jgi:deoxyribose-phosphate aldolase
MLDHSVLKPEAVDDDVLAGAALVRKWGIGFYCVQPYWVHLAAGALAGTDAKVVSVIGFPHGVDRTDVKVQAARLAAADGAAELDMVINLGALLSERHDDVRADIEAVVQSVPGIPVKVILETAALRHDDKRTACALAREAGAAFVKTSTGFHPAGGATVEDVALMREEVGPDLGVKASGGIRALADAMAMLRAGANRIGTSASAAILAAVAD